MAFSEKQKRLCQRKVLAQQPKKRFGTLRDEARLDALAWLLRNWPKDARAAKIFPT